MGFKVTKKKQVEIERLIPIDQNNEQYLLGCAMNNHSRLETLVNEVDPDMFLYENHRAMCSCLHHLYNNNVKVTPDSIDVVKKQFKGGLGLKMEYTMEMSSVFSETPDEQTYQFHVGKLKDDKVKEKLSMYMIPSLTRSMMNTQTTTDIMYQQVCRIKDMLENSTVENDFRFIPMTVVDDDHTRVVLERMKGGSFGTTGYGKLDRYLTDGFARTKLTIVAGRPAMGKSALVGNMLLRLALLGIPVAIFNFEMDCISMYDRLISIRANIEINKLVKDRDKLTDMELVQEKDAKEELRKLPIYFYTASTQSMEGIKRDIRILKEKYKVQVVAYDLFDKIQFKFSGNRSTADVLNEALKQIQGFGRDYDFHQILVVQIGRSAERRKDKRPKLSELKDAGGYEERADNVFFLYRPTYYDTPENEDDEETNIEKSEDVEIIIAKQRQGVSNVKVLLDFWPATTTIAEPLLTSTDY